ncbi:hypothetical protein [Nonomuraea sp. NPDC049480]|uniref:hypothetical protein n=1 Tax=Nonomuraea sp. NPDC049480 TaxID=3364353 RepID=UPI0037AB9604
MIYEHPLAYVLRLGGMALLRSFTGAYDREFVHARLAEIRTLLDDDSLANAAVEVTRVDPVEGYRIWSTTYDGPNAACGTGRLSAYLAGRGHRVVFGPAGTWSSRTCIPKGWRGA